MIFQHREKNTLVAIALLALAKASASGILTFPPPSHFPFFLRHPQQPLPPSPLSCFLFFFLHHSTQLSSEFFSDFLAFSPNFPLSYKTREYFSAELFASYLFMLEGMQVVSEMECKETMKDEAEEAVTLVRIRRVREFVEGKDPSSKVLSYQ